MDDKQIEVLKRIIRTAKITASHADSMLQYPGFEDSDIAALENDANFLHSLVSKLGELIDNKVE